MTQPIRIITVSSSIVITVIMATTLTSFLLSISDYQQPLLSENRQSLHQSSLKAPKLLQCLRYVGVDDVTVQDGGDPVEGLPGTESTAGPHSTVRPYEVHTALIVLSKEVIVCWDLK